MPSDRLPAIAVESVQEYATDWPDAEVRQRVARAIGDKAAEQVRTRLYVPVDTLAWSRVASRVRNTLNRYQYGVAAW